MSPELKKNYEVKNLNGLTVAIFENKEDAVKFVAARPNHGYTLVAESDDATVEVPPATFLTES